MVERVDEGPEEADLTTVRRTLVPNAVTSVPARRWPHLATVDGAFLPPVGQRESGPARNREALADPAAITWLSLLLSTVHHRTSL